MATHSATVRYASRSAVSGNAAYDFSKLRANAQPERIPVHKPAEKPAAAPVPKAAPKTQQRPATRAAHRAQKSYGVSMFAITGFLVVAVMMVFVLLANVRYNEVASETVALQAELDALNEQERKLMIEHENAFDVNAVEQYATNVLGMSKPEESQMGTVTSTAYDKAVVVAPEKEEKPVTESMVTFLASLVSYFK